MTKTVRLHWQLLPAFPAARVRQLLLGLHNSRSECQSFCLELWKLDTCNLTVKISATKWNREVSVKEKMRQEREDFHFKSLSITSSSPTLLANTSLTTRKKRKGWEKKGKTSCCWCWLTQTLEMRRQRRWRWTDLTWWCPWCWGCSGTGPGTGARRTRMCWRSRRAAGPFWWAWQSVWRCRWIWADHFRLWVSRSRSVSEKEKIVSETVQVGFASRERFRCWAGLCCYSESVLSKWKAINALLIFKAFFVVKAEAQIRSLIQDPQIWGETIGFCRQSNPTSAKIHLTEGIYRDVLWLRTRWRSLKKKNTEQNTWTEKGAAL